VTLTSLLCAETVHLADDCFRDLGDLRRDDSFGDAAIAPVWSGQRRARRSELSRCPAAPPRGRHSRRVAQLANSRARVGFGASPAFVLARVWGEVCA
jgi:hypothetical protein